MCVNARTFTKSFNIKIFLSRIFLRDLLSSSITSLSKCSNNRFRFIAVYHARERLCVSKQGKLLFVVSLIRGFVVNRQFCCSGAQTFERFVTFRLALKSDCIQPKSVTIALTCILSLSYHYFAMMTASLHFIQFLLTALLLGDTLSRLVRALPSGAPSTACNSLSPFHGFFTTTQPPATSPFVIRAINAKKSAEESSGKKEKGSEQQAKNGIAAIQVTITTTGNEQTPGRGGAPFRGYIVQVLSFFLFLNNQLYCNNFS